MPDYKGFPNVKQARLTSPGAVEWSTGGEMTLTDVYAITIDAPASQPSNGAWRPQGYDISYVSGGQTVTKPKNVSGIPARSSSHPDYPFMKATNISWSQPDPASRTWTCNVQYRYSPENRTTNIPDTSGGSLGTQTAIEAEFYSNNITVPASYFNSNGSNVALTNTAGEPITPEPSINVASPCLRITVRNKMPASHYVGYMGTINNADITICGIAFPKYSGRLTYSTKEVEVQVSENTTQSMYEHVFNIEGNLTPAPSHLTEFSLYNGFRIAGWVTLIPNAGYNYKDDQGRLIRAQVQSAWDPSIFTDSPMPVFLDAAGKRLSSGSNILYLACPSAPMANWANIGFPATW